MSNKIEKNKDEAPTVTVARVAKQAEIEAARIQREAGIEAEKIKGKFSILKTILTVLGTIAVAIIGVIKVPSLISEISPVSIIPTEFSTLDSSINLTPTNTLVANDIFTSVPPTLTSLPPALIDTPIPTAVIPTIATIHSTSIPGDDWAIDCIDLTTWMPYLAGGVVSSTGYCSQLATWGITAQDGALFLNTLRSQSAAKEYGLSTSLPMRAEIELMVDVEELENSEVWIGIFDADVSDKLSGYVFVIQPGASMDFRKLPVTNIVNNQEYVYIDQYYPIRIVLDAGRITVWVSKNKMVSDYPIPFSNRELFIGYRSLPNTQLDASIYDLKITTP